MEGAAACQQRDQHRSRERSPKLQRKRLERGGLRHHLGRESGEHRDRERNEHQPQADTCHDRRPQQRVEIVLRGGDVAEPDLADADQGETHDQQDRVVDLPAAGDARDERRERGDEERAHENQFAGERRGEAEQTLDVLRQDHRRAEQHGADREAERAAGRDGAILEGAQIDQRPLRAPELPPDEGREPNAVVAPNSRISGSENQSLRCPSSRMYCSEPSPIASSAKPSPSIGIGLGSVGLRIIVRMTKAAKMPGTRLMKKT